MSVTSWNSIRDFDPLHGVLQMIPDYIWLKDKAGVYLACNHAVTRLLGAKEEEIVGKTDYDFFDKRVADAFHQKDEEAIAAKHILITEEWVTLQENNKLILLETRKVQVCDSNGDIVGILNVGRDITQPKHIEIERQRLIDIIEESVDFIGSADMQGKLLYHNHSARQMLGLPYNFDIEGMSISDMHPEWALKLVHETAIPTVFSKGVWRGESALLHQNGYEIPVFQTLVLHRDEQGKPEFLSTIMQDITARKQNDERLALLDYAFNHINEAIFLIDENARFVQVNKKACSSLGYTREELLKLRVFDIDPDFKPEHWDNLRSGILDGTLSAIIETQHKTKDGRIFPVEVSANHIFYGSGGEHYDMAMVRDISERKTTERQIALLNYALDHVGEAAWLIDENAQFHYNNAEACRAIGYSREELLLLGVPNIDPDYQLDIWPKHWQDLKTNGSLIFESRHRRRDGHIFPVEINANYFEFDGKGYNFALIRDITERKQAQEALERSEALLAEAQRIAHIGSWEVDIVHNRLFWSDETFRIWEIGKSEFGATIEAFYETVHPEDSEKVANAFNESIENKTLYQVEHRLLFPDGRIKYIAERGEPICDENGNVIRFIGTALDITSQQHIKNTLEFVAQRGWGKGNTSFLDALTNYLAKTFGVDYVIIDKLGSLPTQAETVALYVKGQLFPNMEYDLKGTPCADVFNGKLCCHPENVQQLFPDDILLVEMQVESYAGLPLWDTTGKVIGLIAVMDSKPLNDTAFVSSILQLVATSVAAELERQRAEQALFDSHHFLKQIVNTLADPVFVKDRAHRWVLINQAFCEFIGYPIEQLHDKSDYDFFPAYQADVFWEKDELVFSSGEENINEEKFTDAKGFLRTIITKKTCYTDNNGQQFLVGIITDITERKQMEDELAVREQQFRVLAESLPSPVFRFDKDCNRIYMNPIAEKITGKTAEELLYRKASDSSPMNQEELNKAEKIIEHVLKTGEPQEGEVLFRVPDTGEIYYFHNSYAPEFDINGNVTGVISVSHNITERKKMEEIVRQREQEFRTIAENVPDNLLRYDLQCHLHYMNPATLLSLSPEMLPILGKTPSESFPNNDTAIGIENTIKHVMETGKACEKEIPWLNFDGNIGVHHIRYIAERDSEGNITGALMIGRDISEQKQMEEQLRQREQEFRILVETSPAPIIRYDANCRRIYVNPAVEKMSGKTAGEMLDHVPTEGTVLAEHIRSEVEETLQYVLKTGQATEREVKLVLPDGKTHYFFNRYAPELDVDGKPSGVVLVGHDITELKRMEEILHQREQEFRVLVETSPSPIYRYDNDCRLIYVNPAVEKMTGRTAAELLEYVPSDDSILNQYGEDELKRILRHVLETGETAENEVNYIFADGEIHYFSNRYAPELDTNGKIVGVVLVANDITARKHAEELLFQREQEFRTLVDNLPTVVLRYNNNLERIYANRTYYQVTGITKAEFASLSVAETWRCTNISAEDYLAVLANTMRTGNDADIILECPDTQGKLCYFETKIVPEYDRDEQVQNILVLGFDSTERHRQQLVENNRQLVFEKMAHGDSLDFILEQVALYVESSKSGRYCAILLFDETEKHLELVAAPSFPDSYCAKSGASVLDIKHEHCTGWLTSASLKQRVVIENINGHPCYSLCQRFIREIGAKASWAEPILSASNQLLGVVTIYLNQVGAPDEQDSALLLQAGHLSAIAIERKRIEHQMSYQASYDALTGLPNRRMFNNRLRTEILRTDRSGQKLALLFIDLDHFKEVNDTLGHDTGDKLLVDAAKRIQHCIRESDTVARLGGDEFVVILPDVGDIPPLERIAEAIIETMIKPFRFGEYVAYISASVGIAVYPQDADNAVTLMSCADQAMYSAKEQGRNSFNFFTHSMQEQAHQRLYLINSLRRALDNGQLEMYFQPIVDVVSGKAVKAEALLRWSHPNLGMVSPAVFIPLAEETNLIQEIGSWVFYRAADMAKRWNSLTDDSKPRKVSINMSPRQLTKGNGEQIAIDYLKNIELDSSCVVIEITEGLLLDNSPDIIEKLAQLRTAGIELSLDDFGTGYSAISYLKKFNLDYLKIDRSFIIDLATDENDRAITEAIVVMAHRLGLKVIAEGVETEGQRALLAAVGCEYIQGYFYSKPLPAEAFLSYVLQ